MFKVLLQRWGDKGEVRVTAHPDPDHAARTRFDVRFQDGPHWQIREQVNLSQHKTVPDFYATRVDATGTAPIAVYLDGWAFHQQPDRIDADAVRRASLRAAGTRVWTLTYSDVKAAIAATNGGGSVSPAMPLGAPARNRAGKGIGGQLGSAHVLAELVKLGAFEQLMMLLRHPQADDWRKLATVVALAPVQGATVVDVADIVVAVAQAARGTGPQPAATRTGDKAASWETTGGLIAHAILDSSAATDQACTAVITLDTRSDVEQDRWADWLHLGNVVAGLTDNAIITTTRIYAEDESISPIAAAGAAAPDESIAALLEDCFDDVAKDLAAAVARLGHTNLIVGFEPGWPDGTVIEVAWPDRKVGILAAGSESPTDSHAWSLHRSTDWTVEALTSALDNGTA